MAFESLIRLTHFRGMQYLPSSVPAVAQTLRPLVISLGPLSGNSRLKSRKSTENANNLFVSPDLWCLRDRSRDDHVLFSRKCIRKLREDHFKFA